MPKKLFLSAYILKVLSLFSKSGSLLGGSAYWVHPGADTMYIFAVVSSHHDSGSLPNSLVLMALFTFYVNVLPLSLLAQLTTSETPLCRWDHVPLSRAGCLIPYLPNTFLRTYFQCTFISFHTCTSNNINDQLVTSLPMISYMAPFRYSKLGYTELVRPTEAHC